MATMDAKPIENQLRQIIHDQLGCDPGEITAEANFWDDLGCDSLDSIEIVMAVEEYFGIQIKDEEAEVATRFKDAVELVERYLAEKAGLR